MEELAEIILFLALSLVWYIALGGNDDEGGEE